jgi:hypothetical protein
VLRGLLTRRNTASSEGIHRPRASTKQSQVLAMPWSPEGATVAQIAKAMQWAPHTVRGLFAGLKKRQGISVTPERIHQVGAEGAKDSHTIYRLIEAA